MASVPLHVDDVMHLYKSHSRLLHRLIFHVEYFLKTCLGQHVQKPRDCFHLFLLFPHRHIYINSCNCTALRWVIQAGYREADFGREAGSCRYAVLALCSAYDYIWVWNIRLGTSKQLGMDVPDSGILKHTLNVCQSTRNAVIMFELGQTPLPLTAHWWHVFYRQDWSPKQKK